MADGILIPCNVACGSGIMTVNSRSAEVAAGLPCKVTRGSGMTCHWIRQVAAPCNVACGCGIMTVNSRSGSRPTLQIDMWLWDYMSLNSPGGSTLQCGRWLWDDMPWNSPKRRPYWNSTTGFDFDHITAVDMSFCTSLRNFIQIRPLSCRKNDVMSIFQDGGSPPSWILGVQ